MNRILTSTAYAQDMDILTSLQDIADAFGFSLTTLNRKLRDRSWSGNALIKTERTAQDPKAKKGKRRYRVASRREILAWRSNQ